MTNQDAKIEALRKEIKLLEKTADGRYSFSVIAKWKDPANQDFPIITKQQGERVFQNAMASVKKFNPDVIEIEIYRSKGGSDAPRVIEIDMNDTHIQEESADKRKIGEMEQKIDSILDKLEKTQQESQTQLGALEQLSITQSQNAFKDQITEIKHGIEIAKLQEQILKKQEEIIDLNEDLKEATSVIQAYERKLGKIQKVEDNVGTTLAAVKTILQLSPNLLTLADKYGLGGLASALVQPGELPHGPSAGQTAASGSIQIDDESIPYIEQYQQYLAGLDERQKPMLADLLNYLSQNPDNLTQIHRVINVPT